MANVANNHNFCCICLEENEEFENITEYDPNGVKYSEKLALCDPTQNWEDKTLSLCKNCVHKVNIVYEFIEECRKSDVLRREKLQHLKEELEEKKVELETFTCYACKKSFKKKRFLKAHITRIHVTIEDKSTRDKTTKDAEPESSEESQLNAGDQDDTKENIKTESLPSNYQERDYFSQNDASYSSGEELEKPKVKKPTRKRLKKAESFTCEYCGKQFNRHQHWSAHIRSKHTFEKPYKCTLCEASFTTSHSLLVHKRNHNNEKPYICSTCGKRFVCSGDLFHHNKIHLNKKEYECTICQKRFNTTSILRTHKIVKHTEPQDWKYLCLLCNRRFPINSGLTLHLKRHSGIKDHACHICGKKFFNKSEVSKHILSHSNQKNFRCGLCEDKEYKNKEGLNKHLKIIHDLGNWKAPKLEKKFFCMLCPKKFTFNNKLQRHILTHTGEKPYKCDFCDKKFSDIYYRKSHMRKEHGEQVEEDGGNDVKFVELIAVPSESAQHGFNLVIK
ncbi:hypothetical protein HUJ04_000954 [Dendroctonus ponderosae]|uniref:C2H2-type domain-containing protein n=1 Tax=Dendroctonus ponderosae TaxID=77166 RepID=A0AAR5Q902_DENPD|nr:hypothetical protein HUJ04_000954 [Dendroctonus ponderosae]